MNLATKSFEQVSNAGFSELVTNDHSLLCKEFRFGSSGSPAIYRNRLATATRNPKESVSIFVERLTNHLQKRYSTSNQKGLEPVLVNKLLMDEALQ